MSSEGRNTIALHLGTWATRTLAPRVSTVVLEDELGVEDLAQVGQKLLGLGMRGCVGVVLDFTEVPHLDYRGVRPLLAQVERFRQGGGEVKLAGLSPYLAAILRAAGAHGQFDCYATPEEAQAAFTPGLELASRWR
jgi:anti-anti-sigma factor